MSYQTQPLFEDAISTGTLGAVNEVVKLTLNNSSGAIVNISGTWVGTIIFEGTNDKFVTVQNAAVFTPPAGVITAGVTTNAYYRFVAVSGFTQIRARMSAYTSGTATIVLSASIGSGLAPTVSINYDSMLGTSKLTGNTDGTKIGNAGDRLKVDAAVSTSSPMSFSQKLRYLDMNVANGGVVRGSSITEAMGWTDVFSYTGSGLLTGFTLNLQVANAGWLLRIILDDTEELFGATGLSTDDLSGANTYNLTSASQNITTQGLNISSTSASIYYTAPAYFPIRYGSKITIKLKRAASQGTKTFNAGFIAITKET